MDLGATQRYLDELLRSFDAEARRLSDPVRFVHRFSGADDQEVVGLIAALLAFGNVRAIGNSVERVLAAVGPSPAEAIDLLPRRELDRRLQGFVHRVYRGADVVSLLGQVRRVRREEGNLAAAFQRHFEACGDLREALARFADRLRGPDPSRGLAHLVSDPRKGSASKRLLLYLRWMIRPADGVDLGLWPLDPAHLVIPLDTHVHRISLNLGLTQRRTASFRAAEEITAVLRTFDPHDPVKYDFAICHFGVSRECPSRRDPAKCQRCVLRPVCRAWTD